MSLLILRGVVAIIIAILFGKIAARFKLPSLLGWLVAGMVLGPYAFNLMSEELVTNHWYEVVLKILECAVGLMIGTELVWKKLKEFGKPLVVTTLFQSLGTYIIVSLCFLVVFMFTGTPWYVAFIFGGIALATAPAPALSIVKEFKTSGPVTSTLIPMAALDDMVGVICFFTTIAFVSMQLSGGDVPLYLVPVMIILPLLIGVLPGLVAGKLLQRYRTKQSILAILISSILVTALIGFYCNTLLPAPILNFMLMGMSFAATFANVVFETGEELEHIMEVFEPILGFALIVVIINLGVPLDYHAIVGTGIFTIVYIASRAVGKYYGARLGAKKTGLPETVQRYLGFTLLPHSGVSLIFAGIAVSVLSKFAPDTVPIVQGTIAAAAIINEVIAVIMAKKAFEWSGEMTITTKE